VSDRNTPYGHTAKLLFRWAKEANDAGDHFPIYGTCQGFQLMCQLAANNFTLKQRVKGCVGVSKPLEFTHKAKSSRLFGSLPETPCGEHMHNYCITPETFEGTALSSSYVHSSNSSFHR
jgi:gamma-glutamyl hydrolase